MTLYGYMKKSKHLTIHKELYSEYNHGYEVNNGAGKICSEVGKFAD